MLIDLFKVLSSEKGDGIETILYEMQVLAAKGCTKWSGIVTENISKVINFFETEGFTVTKSSIIPLLITISWNG